MVTSIDVNENLSIELNKKIGSYITVEFEDITNHEDEMEVMKILKEELASLLRKKGIKDNDSCLVLGLGNRSSTADSL